MPGTLFVGREREQQLYHKFLAKKTSWVLIITGQGGIGKSTLLHHLAEQTPHDIPVVTLDFADEALRTDPLNILERVASCVKPFCDKQQTQVFKQTLRDCHRELAALHKEAQRAIRVSERASWPGVSLRASINTVAVREVHLQVREQVTEAFYQQVDTFRPAHLVIMLDTFEWLSEPQGLELGQWVKNEFIAELQMRMQEQQQQCSFVIASRTRPSLEVISKQNQWCLDLAMLNQEGVDQYLEHIGMHDPELRQYAYAITHGHALSVSIIGALWQEQGEQSFMPADLPKLQEEFNERAWIDFIQERLDKRLQPPFRELTHYGALLRSFNLPLLQAVFPELLPEPEAFDRFQQFIGYPYIESVGNYRYAFHDLLRSIQAAYVREQEPPQWTTYHKRALDYFDQTAPHAPDWYYHALAYDEEQGMPDWLEAVQTTQIHGDRESLNALLQVAYDVTLKLSPTGCAKRAYLQGVSYYSNLLMDAALPRYEEALALYRQLENLLGEANVLRAMGDIAQFHKDMETALQHYEQALALYQQVGNPLGQANVRKTIGDVLQFRDSQDAALQQYEQALILFRQVEDPLGEANVRKAIGDTLRLQEKLNTAFKNYELALTLYQEVGDPLGEANVLQTMGEIARYYADQDGALRYHEQALALYRQVGNILGEANVHKAIGDVLQFRQDMEAALESYEQAFTLYQEVGDDLGKANTLQAMGDILRLRNNIDAALPMYEEALALYQHIGDRLGEAYTRKAIGDVLQPLDKLNEAVKNYECALNLYQQIGDRLGEANVLQTMGEVQLLHDDLDGALKYFERALVLYQQVGSKLGEANCYQAQGNVKFEQENYQQALMLHTSAYLLFQQLQDEYSQARLLYYRSLVYEALDEQQRALQDAEEAFIIAERLHLPYVDLFHQQVEALRK